MRTIPTQALAQLANPNGTEPYCIVGITWAPTTGEYLYADRVTEDPTIPAKVLSINALENVVDLQGSGSATNISITLDDIDGTVKALFDQFDIHKRPCRIYQAFYGLSVQYKFVLYEGFIESPIVWSEQSRQLSFTLVSLVEQIEIGFSPEEGQFPNLPTSDVGVCWPLAFGTPFHYPGLTYQPIPVGTTLNPFYYVNSDLDVVDPATTLQGYLADNAISYTAQPIYFNDSLPTNTGDAVFDSLNATMNQLADALDSRPPPGESTFFIGNQEYDNHDYDLVKTTPPSFIAPLPQPNQSAYFYLDTTQEELTAKGARSDGVQLLNGGYGFPIGVKLTLSMGNHVFEGQMNSTGFMTLKELVLPTATLAYTPPVYGRIDMSLEGRFQTQQAGIYFTPDGSFSPAEYNAMGTPGFNSVGEAPIGYTLTQGLQSDGFQVFDAGSSITVLGDLSIDYIVNIIPTTVNQVYGYRAVGNVKTLSIVPSDRWSQVTVNFNGIEAQIVRLKRPLPNYPGEGWDDGIYVDQTSSIGPNPAAIIAWCVETYSTTLTIDNDSFNEVGGYLDNYPMNFVYAQKTDLIEFISDLAWQCRCAIYVKDFTVFIKYLPKDDDPVATLTQDDIIENTIEISTTETERLVTRYTGTYIGDYALGTQNDVVVRSDNIRKYGVFYDSHDFFGYTEAQYVLKTLTYWTIIKSNIFKRIRFSCPLTMLNLESFDTITLDFGDDNSKYLCYGTTNVRIESCSYDSVGNKIDIECWVPVRLGEMLQYEFAYPQNVSSTLFYPTVFADEQTNVYQDFRQSVIGTLSTVAGQQTGTSFYDVPDPEGFGLLFYPPPDPNSYVGEDGQVHNTDPEDGNAGREVTDLGSQYPSDLADSPPGTRTSPSIPLLSPINFPASPYTPNNATTADPAKFLQTPGPQSIPGKITGGSANEYQVDIYPLGTDKTAENITATCLNLDPSDNVASGTWVTISRITLRRTTPDGSLNSATAGGAATQYSWVHAYYFLVPCWTA